MTKESPTFTDFDKFDRKPFADRLTKVITRFYPLYDQSFVLSMNAKFGSGKTTFLKMWQHDLENKKNSKGEKEPFKVIYIDAWKSDFDEEPLLQIISSILEELEKDKGKKTKAVVNAFKTVIGAAALTINQLSPIDVENIIGRIEEDKAQENLTKIGENLFKEYTFKKTAYENLTKCLIGYTTELKDKPLIIFIDELDRVRPNYAVKYLEAIKHFFSIQGICFVLAVDKNQLRASVEQLYGGIDFEGYYLRFITREVELPNAYNCELKPYLEHLSKDYFDQKNQHGIMFPFPEKEKQNILDFIEITFKAFDFKLRELEYLMRIFVHFIYVEDDQRNARITWIKATILLISISIKDKPLYHKIGGDIASPQDIEEFIMSLKPTHKKSDLKYLMFLAQSFYLIEDDDLRNNKAAKICLKIDNRDPNTNAAKRMDHMIQHLANSVSEHGLIFDDKSTFKDIYNKIEDWQHFLLPLTK